MLGTGTSLEFVSFRVEIQNEDFTGIINKITHVAGQQGNKADRGRCNVTFHSLDAASCMFFFLFKSNQLDSTLFQPLNLSYSPQNTA